MGRTNDVGRVCGCAYAVSLFLDSFCLWAFQLEFVPSAKRSRGGIWFGMFFLQRAPQRPRRKLGSDAVIVFGSGLAVFGGWFGRWFGSVSRGRFGEGLALILGPDLGLVFWSNFWSISWFHFWSRGGFWKTILVHHKFHFGKKRVPDFEPENGPNFWSTFWTQGRQTL